MRYKIISFYSSLALLIILMLASASFAAKVKNLQSKQVGNRVLFEYDLTGNEDKSDVSVTLTINGKEYKAEDLHLEGDYGKVKIGKDKKIYWNVLQDFPRGLNTTFESEITTKDKKTVLFEDTDDRSIFNTVKKRGVIRIGSGNFTPPMHYIDEKGEWVGFDIDLGNAIAERLGLKVERISVNNKTRITLLANRTIDLTISYLSRTKSHDDFIDFAEPSYLFTGKIFYAKKGKFKKPIEICGHRIAVLRGSNAYTSGQKYLEEMGCKKDFKVISFQNNTECFLALKQGKVDAFIQDMPIIAGVTGAEGLGYEAVGGAIFSPSFYSIGVPPNDTKWQYYIGIILQQLIKDGTYEEIYNKWFGLYGKFPLPINARIKLPEDFNYDSIGWTE